MRLPDRVQALSPAEPVGLGRATDARRSRRAVGGLLAQRRLGWPDRAPGRTYDLDGSHITDKAGFHLAIGEAINGPGGYFGCNLDALDDCLCGGVRGADAVHIDLAGSPDRSGVAGDSYRGDG
ncbi:barstar family protein [Microbispora bryophytorum]|uniref:barstar family protein n=1 Tax=Microbispora bryophytorum TaxID=1460882 RepID=UPI0033F14B41